MNPAPITRVSGAPESTVCVCPRQQLELKPHLADSNQVCCSTV